MLRTLSLRRLLGRSHAPQAAKPAPAVVVVPDLGPLNNRILLAQYRRKKAIKAANPDAVFPLEIYE